ncbi:acyl CoA:acetate/3-ketoacid CoA transferase [Acuticoccus kandeliae]|uniref:acyl CoA:acetate/3-ketoacid CoA transferase n=1 Tax=Acuticoccus kandeliae TaxID=2073160 RepID=UPI000D3EADA7|nr:CoA-transferase [Acuticoccus kandeliae]
MGKPVMTAEAVAAAIPDGATIMVTGSGGGMLEADAIFAAMERRFLETGSPRDLTLIHALGFGDRAQRGTNRFSHEGMVRRVIGGHWTWSRPMQLLAANDKIEAYSLPSGVISLLMREIGAGRPGLITKTGLGTFVDPLHGGGKVNKAAKEDLIERIVIDGETYLRYKPMKIDVAIMKATSADASGSLTTREEPADLDIYNVALAAHNSGGTVYAQVREVLPTGTLRPREVTVPAILVDALIIEPEQQQTYLGGYRDDLAGLARSDIVPEKIDARGGPKRVIALRASEELTSGACLNFGFGASAGVAEIISERGAYGDYWTTIEQGIHGGAMLTGDLFGMAVNANAIMNASEQFDFYHGGGLDAAFLGMAEVDRLGNVNVSHMGGFIVGPGGFIDITHNAKKVVFCGTFDTKGSKIEILDGGIRIVQNGAIKKFVDTVGAITFSGEEAVRRGQEVVYVTERAVFRLTPNGLALVEIAEGVDIEADILARMDFRPIVDNPRRMPAAHFKSETVAA